MVHRWNHPCLRLFDAVVMTAMFTQSFLTMAVVPAPSVSVSVSVSVSLSLFSSMIIAHCSKGMQTDSTEMSAAQVFKARYHHSTDTDTYLAPRSPSQDQSMRLCSMSTAQVNSQSPDTLGFKFPCDVLPPLD